MTDDRTIQDKRAQLFEIIEDAHLWVSQQASALDMSSFDLEAARVTELARLTGRSNPRLPVIRPPFGQNHQIQSLDDLDAFADLAALLLGEVLSDPGAYGVEMEDQVEEVRLRLPGQTLENP